MEAHSDDTRLERLTTPKGIMTTIEELREQCGKQNGDLMGRAANELESLTRERDELKSKFPHIGDDPLKKDGDERKIYGSIDKTKERLEKGVTFQQSGVPDQTMLAWRIDVSRLCDEYTWLRPAWEGLRKQVEDLQSHLTASESERVLLRDQLLQCQTAFNRHGWSTGQLDGVLASTTPNAVEERLKELKKDKERLEHVGKTYFGTNFRADIDSAIAKEDNDI